MSQSRDGPSGSQLRKKANQSAQAGNPNNSLEAKNIVQMKIGYPPEMATVQIDKMKSRMGRATESHFAVLNTKIIERKQEARSFDPAKVLNPALRAQVKEEGDNKADFIKVKALFMGDEAKKRQALNNGQSFMQAKTDAKAGSDADNLRKSKDEGGKNTMQS